jgi:hypothetical protein
MPVLITARGRQAWITARGHLHLIQVMGHLQDTMHHLPDTPVVATVMVMDGLRMAMLLGKRAHHLATGRRLRTHRHMAIVRMEGLRAKVPLANGYHPHMELHHYLALGEDHLLGIVGDDPCLGNFWAFRKACIHTRINIASPPHSRCGWDQSSGRIE